MSRSDSCGRIETLTGQLSAFLNEIGTVHNSGNGVGEVKGEKTADDTDDAVEGRNRSSDNESEDPVDGAETDPEPATLLGGDAGEMEDFLADFDVDGLEADVEV